ncbi:MAG: sigma-54-dependent Fis family transcriptional regulator [Candidatus Latescibacteria bacterium]|nr:sigma-54-dependent Fis family transcriptional regulator [Candidatus Latescibacterota bacterium]
MSTLTILIADDDARTRATLGKVLEEDGYRVVQAEDGLEALKKLQDERVDLLLLDLKMPQLDGLTILRALGDRTTTMPVIVFTAYGTIQTAVEAMKLGAYDFLEKPLHVEHVGLTIRRALDHARLRHEHSQFVTRLRVQAAIVGRSASMRQIADLMAKVAGTTVTVLIQGESGTGKELIARAIHAASGRAGGPYVVVNCAALPGELIESELFGHGRGAFTGAVRSRIGKVQSADRGTLFLDEVGDMSLAAQAKVLRVLESGEVEPLGQDRPMSVSVRVLAATNKDLKAEMTAGRFREDLYHRLNVMTIRIPPLRERRSDIPELIQHFLAEFCQENHFSSKVALPEALDRLMARDWPGNVRELKHAAQKLALLVDGTEIAGQDVRTILDGGIPTDQGSAQGDSATLREARSQFERDFILRRLIAHQWQVEAAARALGLEYTYLYKKMKALGIEPGLSPGGA